MGKTARNKNRSKTKSKKKSIENPLALLSQEELIQRAQDEIDTFNYVEAQKYCQEALKRNGDDLKTLEMSACLCMETGNLDGAKHCLGRAITLSPDSGFSKYLSMGQLLEGKDSLQCYLKGIEILNFLLREKLKQKCNGVVAEPQVNGEKEENEDKNEENNSKTYLGNKKNILDKSELKDESSILSDESSDALVRKLSNTYCAIAELYMSDLCDEEEAEIESESCIKKAIDSDPTNPEAFHRMASFLLVKEDFEEAKKFIKKSVSLWLPKYQQVDEGEASAGSFDPVEVCSLSQSERMDTARTLIEVEEYELASDVLEGLLGEDDQDAYTWYLLGWNFYLQGKGHKLAAKHHLEKALELQDGDLESDPEVIKHSKELLEELKGVEEDEEENIEELDEEDIEKLEEEDIEELEEEIDKMDVS